MKFFCLIVALILQGYFSKANWNSVYGPEGLSKDDLIKKKGFQATTQNGKDILARGSDRIVAQSDFVAFKVKGTEEEVMQYVELDSSGKALSKTFCHNYGGMFGCSTQTNSYCNSLRDKVGSLGKKALDACSDILNAVQIDRKGNEVKYKKAAQIFSSELGVRTTSLQYPSMVNAVSALIEDYEQCDSLAGGTFGSSHWATSGNNSTLESLPSTFPKATQ